MASQICEECFAFAKWLMTGIFRQKRATGDNTRLLVKGGIFGVLSTGLVKASVTRVSLMNLCGKPSVHHPPYHNHLLNIIAY